jgi:hypothetical protein
MRIPENEIADEEAKTALENDLLATDKYPPQELINWIKTENKKTRKTRWNKDTKLIKRRNQVVISRLRTGYIATDPS